MASANLISGCILLSLLATSALATLNWHCEGSYCFGSDLLPRTLSSLEEANQVCRNADGGSWLLEIYDEYVQKAVMNYMQQQPRLHDHTVLLNMVKKGGDWRWIDHSTFDNALATSNQKVKLYTSVPFATLRNLPLRGIYGDTYVTTRLRDHICTFAGVCDKKKARGTRYLQQGDKCFVSYENINKDGFTWFEAQKFCYQKGGNLAVFSGYTPKRLHTTFRTFAKRMRNYWVGLIKYTWEWKHNNAFVSNYTNWYTGYPYPPLLDLDSVYTVFSYSNGGIWTDRHWTPTAPVVCMKDNPAAPHKRDLTEVSTATAVTDLTTSTAEPLTASSLGPLMQRLGVKTSSQQPVALSTTRHTESSSDFSTLTSTIIG